MFHYVIVISLALMVGMTTGCGRRHGRDGINGTNGTNGVDGLDAVADIIDPCGKQGAHDEVILVLSDGQLLASFSDAASGLNTRFSLIGPGNYVTTDGTNCHFSVDSDLNVTF